MTLSRLRRTYISSGGRGNLNGRHGFILAHCVIMALSEGKFPPPEGQIAGSIYRNIRRTVDKVRSAAAGKD